jgi:hypothetical protein
MAGGAAHFNTFTHGYAVTSHSSQSKTVDEVLLVASSRSFAAVNREQFYVSGSRGRERIHVFTDDAELLARRVTDSHERKAAVELQALRDDLVRLGFVRGRKPTVEDPTVDRLSPEITRQESGSRIALPMRAARATRLSPVQHMANLVEDVRRRLGEVLRAGQETEAVTEKVERTESIKPAGVVKPTQKLKRSRMAKEALQPKQSMRHKPSWSISPSRDTGHSRGIRV